MTNGMMSTCKTRHVGAVIVRDKRVVADGFNGNLPGHTHCDEGGCERCNDPKSKSGEGLERCVCVHAEQNIISYCASEGVPSKGTTLYVQSSPCIDCFKLIVASGVSEIVYDDMYTGSHNSILRLSKQSGVKIRPFKCKCGA